MSKAVFIINGWDIKRNGQNMQKSELLSWRLVLNIDKIEEIEI